MQITEGQSTKKEESREVAKKEAAFSSLSFVRETDERADERTNGYIEKGLSLCRGKRNEKNITKLSVLPSSSTAAVVEGGAAYRVRSIRYI